MRKNIFTQNCIFMHSPLVFGKPRVNDKAPFVLKWLIQECIKRGKKGMDGALRRTTRLKPGGDEKKSLLHKIAYT